MSSDNKTFVVYEKLHFKVVNNWGYFYVVHKISDKIIGLAFQKQKDAEKECDRLENQFY